MYDINSQNLFLCYCQQLRSQINKNYGSHNGIAYEEIKEKTNMSIQYLEICYELWSTLCYNLPNLISVAVYNWYSKEYLLCTKVVNQLESICVCARVYIYTHLQQLWNVWWSYREIWKDSWLLIWISYSSLVAASCLETCFHSRRHGSHIPSVTYCTLGVMLKKQSLPWCAPDGHSNCTSCSRCVVVLALEPCIGRS